jgi:general secretion pathway protein I
MQLFAARSRMHLASKGFTLIEVLVAFTIASIMLVALLQGMGRGLRSIDRADDRQILVNAAQNQMARLGRQIELRPGIESGEGDGYRWRVTMSDPPPDLASDQIAGGQLRLLMIEISVSDETGAEFHLQTMRLVESDLP